MPSRRHQLMGGRDCPRSIGQEFGQGRVWLACFRRRRGRLPQVSAFPYLAIEVLHVCRWRDIQLTSQYIPAAVVLTYRLLELTLGSVGTHEGLVRGLAQGVESHKALTRGNCLSRVQVRYEARQRSNGHLAQPAALEGEPVVESGVTYRQAVEQIALIEIGSPA